MTPSDQPTRPDQQTRLDPIAAFYEHHPYPPPVADPDSFGAAPGDRRARRFAHHLIWPGRPLDVVRSVLVAGCGTSQAVRHALRRPEAAVVGIDVSDTSIEHTRALAERLGVTNLELARLPIEAADELGRRFDHVVCTGVLHHLADPTAGLRALGATLAPGGAITLMVYAPYGRSGVYLLQDYCRRLGVEPSPAELRDLVATLREIPTGHPLSPLLRETPDFADDDALADALLNPRDRPYSVPQLFELIGDAGLRFARWERQAPYLPQCGSISETPHAARLAELAPTERFAAMELFRGTIARHTAILTAADGPTERDDPTEADISAWMPLVAPSAIAVEERLPRGAAAALINRAHADRDLVLFVDRRDLRTFRAIDGARTVGQMGRGADELMRRMWRHDLVVFDTTGAHAHEELSDDR